MRGRGFLRVVVVLPTYNEKENIERFINVLLSKFEDIEKNYGFNLSILVVDDRSPDKTGLIVEGISSKNEKVKLLYNEEKGLGIAYLKGFHYAIENFDPDVLMQMDSDFSHDPDDIIRLLVEVSKGFDFVIGSRYVKGGSIPADWALIRKLNSYYGNIFARYIVGLSNINDCTSGFRAIRASLLKKIELKELNANGYAFGMLLLYAAVQKNAQVKEIPIHFIDRELGSSKLGLKEITEFIKKAFFIRFEIIKSNITDKV